HKEASRRLRPSRPGGRKPLKRIEHRQPSHVVKLSQLSQPLLDKAPSNRFHYDSLVEHAGRQVCAFFSQFDFRGELLGRSHISRSQPRREYLRKSAQIKDTLWSYRGYRRQPRRIIQVQIEICVVFDYQQIVLFSDFHQLSTPSGIERDSRRVLKVRDRIDAFCATPIASYPVQRLTQFRGHDAVVVLSYAYEFGTGVLKRDDAANVAGRLYKGYISRVEQYARDKVEALLGAAGHYYFGRLRLADSPAAENVYNSLDQRGLTFRRSVLQRNSSAIGDHLSGDLRQFFNRKRVRAGR